MSGSLTYNATTGDFNATTTNPDALTLVTPAYPNGGAFDHSISAALTFDVHLDANGNIVAGGTGFSLTGAVDIDGDKHDDPSGTTTPQTLLTGTITAFGTNGPGPPTVTFNGLFQVTGGLLSGPLTLSGGASIPALFPVGSIDGFMLSSEQVTSGILGDFTSDFSSNKVKSYAGVVTPEPGGLLLVLSGAALMCGYVLVCGRRAEARP
jgi:hypothetical protein